MTFLCTVCQATDADQFNSTHGTLCQECAGMIRKNSVNEFVTTPATKEKSRHWVLTEQKRQAKFEKIIDANF